MKGKSLTIEDLRGMPAAASILAAFEEEDKQFEAKVAAKIQHCAEALEAAMGAGSSDLNEWVATVLAAAHQYKLMHWKREE